MLNDAVKVDAPSRSAHWGMYSRMLRCPKHRMCPLCRDDQGIKPHGPYYRIVRSRPAAWPVKDEVHLGKLAQVQVDELAKLLPSLDKKYPERKPEKRVIMNMIERALK